MLALAKKPLKRELGARGRHQCECRRGDPAGWTRHESLGIRFNSMVAGKIEDLLKLLLMTPLFIVFKQVAVRLPSTSLTFSQALPTTRDVNTYTDKHKMTRQKFPNTEPTKTRLLAQTDKTRTNHDSSYAYEIITELHCSNILTLSIYNLKKTNTNHIGQSCSLTTQYQRKTSNQSKLLQAVTDSRKTFKKPYSPYGDYPHRRDNPDLTLSLIHI